jgi:hypothetical protein
MKTTFRLNLSDTDIFIITSQQTFGKRLLNIRFQVVQIRLDTPVIHASIGITLHESLYRAILQMFQYDIQ